jgi:hypothetical protein
MGTVIQDKQQSNPARPPRWDRFERADLFEHYLDRKDSAKAPWIGSLKPSASFPKCRPPSSLSRVMCASR